MIYKKYGQDAYLVNKRRQKRIQQDKLYMN
jgi:hypothetical protein